MMKKTHSILIVSIIVVILTLFFLNLKDLKTNSNKIVETTYSLKVKGKDNLWIYEIYNNESLFIKQEYIPSVKGNQVFKTKEDAEKIGKLVVSKLSKNTFPVINQEDLITNNIDFDKT